MTISEIKAALKAVHIPDIDSYYNDKIRNWKNIFEGHPPWQAVKVHGLKKKEERKMNMLNTAKVLCDCFSDLTFSEQAEITIDDETYQQYVNEGNSISSSSLATIGAGQGNSISSSSQATIGAGQGNSISSSSQATIGAGDLNIVRDGSTRSGILAGHGNVIEKSQKSGVVSGDSNLISDANQCAILAGYGNKIKKDTGDPTVDNAIITGNQNEISSGTANSAVGSGADNSIKRAMRCFILSGHSNSIDGAADSVILGGNGNKITGQTYHTSSGNAASGYDVIVDKCFYTAAFGTSIRATNVRNGLISGEGHTVKNINDVLFCGRNGTSENPDGNTLSFVVGGGADAAHPKNAAYIDSMGNVYAKSFNIISAEASTLSVASKATAAQTADISALAQQVSQMQAEIEALKAEIAQVKGAAL